MRSTEQFGEAMVVFEIDHFAEARRVSQTVAGHQAGEDRYIYLQFFVYLTKSCMCRS